MSTAVPASVESLQAHVVAVSAKTTWMLLELRFENGVTGWGEATDFGNEVAVADEVALVDSALRESRPADLGPALGILSGRQHSQARRVVRNGLEQAFLDAQARMAGRPLASFLGGPYRTMVPVYANINRGIPAARSPEDFAAQARLAAGDGYGAIKIAPFDGVRWRRSVDNRRMIERGIERILAVRDAVGSDIDLLVDCHSRFDLLTALSMLAAAAPASLFWVEDVLDPCFHAADHRDFRRQAHRHGIRVAGGEEIADLPEFLRFLKAGGTDVVLPDLRLTGVRTGMVICEVAAACGQQVSLHNPVGPVLDAVSQHVAAAMPEFLILERPVRESPLWQTLRGGSSLVTDGSSPLPVGAGLALHIDPAALRNVRERGGLRAP